MLLYSLTLALFIGTYLLIGTYLHSIVFTANPEVPTALALGQPGPIWGLAGLVLGGLLAGLWRGVELGRLRGHLKREREALRESQLAQAALLSERDLLNRGARDSVRDLAALRAERDRLATQEAALETRLQADRQKHREQFALLENSREQMRVEFENLAQRIFEERDQQFSSRNRQSLEALLKPFGEQIDRFQSRIDDVHAQAVRGNASLSAELRHLMGVGLKMSEQAESLSQALQGDKKISGNWGEMQLRRALEMAGLEPGLHYEAQAARHDSAGKLRLPDCIIKLPDGKHLIVDSKVSLVDYARAVDAATEAERRAALKAHVAALKRHVQDLAGKDYSALPGLDSPELVFMFMPIEAAYIEALKFDRELFEEGYRKNVVLVSPTTLLPVLRTVASLWMAYRSEHEAREISAMAGDIYQRARRLAERLEDMGKSLGAVTSKYNKTVTALVGQQGLLGKVERLRGSGAGARGDLPQPGTLHPPIEHERLSGLTAPADSIHSRAPSAEAEEDRK